MRLGGQATTPLRKPRAGQTLLNLKLRISDSELELGRGQIDTNNERGR